MLLMLKLIVILKKIKDEKIVICEFDIIYHLISDIENKAKKKVIITKANNRSHGNKKNFSFFKNKYCWLLCYRLLH